LLLIPCTSVQAQNRDEDLRKQHERLYKDVGKITPHIQALVDDLSNGILVEIENEKIYAKTALAKFYQHIEYKPAWKDLEALQESIKALEGSYDDGLLPVDYHVDVLKSIVGIIENSKDQGAVNHEWVAKFDLLMTDAIILYAFHLLDGKIDPHSLDVQWNFGYAELPGGDGKRLAEAINNHTLLQELHGLRPAIPSYANLMRELAEYRTIAENGGWGTITAGGKIDPGDSELRILQIRRRLEITGDLSNLNNMNSELYDQGLEKDVRYFQERHGLEADGVVGKASFAAMNVPVETKIDQIRVNLERFRWVTHNLSKDYIIVNIARYRAYVVKNSERAFDTNVQVGTDVNKTPVFKSQLKYIEFNPTWTVPRSITVKEMIPKIKKDHNYLTDRNMVLLDGSGKIVPMSSVDFNAISANNFPYTIRQEPGPGNALGEVKFIFPNKYSVYLHDTPSKYLFGKAKRSFSHGCIRTQNPLDLAEVLLEGSKWDKQKIRETLDSKKTTRALIDEPLDVLLLYWTAGLYQQKSVFFYSDIYERDAQILMKLDRDVEKVAFE
ncbi:MAG: L,D-transpeptidase family protein, partial [Bacteroidales bacterium]|nr:L,D-transpeptidase family protein [Bacteroidales bacterium]